MPIPTEVIEAGERLISGEIELLEYMQILKEHRYINTIDIAVVDLVSSLTGEPWMKSEVARLLHSDNKFIKRCIRRVTDVLVMWDREYEEVAFKIIGVARGRLDQE